MLQVIKQFVEKNVNSLHSDSVDEKVSYTFTKVALVGIIVVLTTQDIYIIVMLPLIDYKNTFSVVENVIQLVFQIKQRNSYNLFKWQ